MDGPRQIPLLLSPSFCLGSAREEVIREKALENRARSEQSHKINEHFATISLSDTQCVCLRYPRQSFYPSDPLLSICQDEKSLFAVCHPAHFSHRNPNRGQGPRCRAPPTLLQWEMGEKNHMGTGKGWWSHTQRFPFINKALGMVLPILCVGTEPGRAP